MATQRFYSACDRLISAFIMDNIVHHDCRRCAVGSLMYNNTDWVSLIPELRHLYSKAERTLAEMNINDFTKYSVEEIFEIEKCFEGREYSSLESCCEGTLNNANDDGGFKGLCNVFNYLVSIEDWKEEEKGSDIFELLEALN